MKRMNFTDSLNDFTKQLKKGAFLTVKSGDELNTMTIGWGFSGVMWGKECLIVVVRYSRHTYKLLEGTEEFVVSIPKAGEFKKELGFCGSKSGRDHDKFTECDLNPVYVEGSEVPLIEGCQMHYVCKKMYQQAMDPALIIDKEIHDKYPNHDYHIMYYGEVVGVYE